MGMRFCGGLLKKSRLVKTSPRFATQMRAPRRYKTATYFLKISATLFFSKNTAKRLPLVQGKPF
jgi:hypothetical protein